MKPQTKFQKKIVELSKKLPEITEEQIQYAYDKCLDKYYAINRKTLYCLECGHSWKNAQPLATAILGCTCPACAKKLKPKRDYKPWISESAYFSILTVVNGMQVNRMLIVKKFYKKFNKPHYYWKEVMQHYVDESGKMDTLSIKVNGMMGYIIDAWVLDSELECRQNSLVAVERAKISSFKIYPKKKILPIIKRNGFKGYYHDLAPHILFSLILGDATAETLLKSGQIKLFKYYESRREKVREYWNSVKICIRNNYLISDPVIYFDYLSLLKHFGKDLSNAKYVCPDHLLLAHDKLVHKKREIEKRQKLDALRKRIAIEQKDYEEQKARFFGLQFRDGDMIIKVIESVEECMIEGDELHHCVFANEYYKKPDSLIMSARIQDKPIETIEVSLKDLSILQSRGLQNQLSQHHDRILKLVRSNINKIAKRIKNGNTTRNISDSEKYSPVAC